MNLANWITMMRVILVPIIVWTLILEQYLATFILFLLAGLSDAVDGFIARTFNQQTTFGTVLDPMADKAMLVSIFVCLAILEHAPLWLVILIVFRDIIIVAGVIMAFLLQFEVVIRPLWISKANTFAQIALAGAILAALAFSLQIDAAIVPLIYLTGLLTAASALSYIMQGFRLFNGEESEVEIRKSAEVTVNPKSRAEASGQREIDLKSR